MDEDGVAQGPQGIAWFATLDSDLTHHVEASFCTRLAQGPGWKQQVCRSSADGALRGAHMNDDGSVFSSDLLWNAPHACD